MNQRSNRCFAFQNSFYLQTGPPRTDVLVIQFAEVPQEETDPQGPFNAGAQQGECVIHLEAV